MTTNMVIPAEAMKKIKTNLDHILAHPSHQDSINAKTGSFATTEEYLIKPTELKSLQYRERFFKPNPSLTLGKKLSREALLDETYWTGYEQRPGMADLRPQILARNRYTCQHCGTAVTTTTGEVDHIKPVRRFKRPIDANVKENLCTLYLPCHAAKTQQDRQAESRMRG
jgi:predicted HNH restriction endonuclease